MNKMFVACLAISTILSGCAGDVGVAPDAPLQQRAIPVYRLAADDKVKVTVFGEEALGGTFLVGSDGTIAFPLIGSVPAKGMTLAELTAALTTRLGTEINNPKVSVDVVEYRPFFILGEVNHPGQFSYRTGLTVNSAVATAGGFTYRANQRHVLIQHFGETGERNYVLTPDLPVLPGDTVRVRERYF